MQKGTLVVVWRDNGEALLTRIRSEVEMERGRSTVFVEGIAGCYSLDAVRKVIFHPCSMSKPLRLKLPGGTEADKEALRVALASLNTDAGAILRSSQVDVYEVVVNERLSDLENWGGMVVEFLDNFEGSFEDDKLGQEAVALQEEGLKLGLVRIYPPEEKECEDCAHWSQEGEEEGYCECVESPFCDVITSSTTNCDFWKEY